MTTPSAGSSGSSAFASAPSSTNEPGSSSSRSRSRAKSFPAPRSSRGTSPPRRARCARAPARSARPALGRRRAAAGRSVHVHHDASLSPPRRGHSPVNTGGRFSANARSASTRSFVPRQSWYSRFSSSSASSRGRWNPSSIARFACRSEIGAFRAIPRASYRVVEELLGRDELGHEPHRERLGGEDASRSEDEILRARDAHEPREPLRPAPPGMIPSDTSGSPSCAASAAMRRRRRARARALRRARRRSAPRRTAAAQSRCRGGPAEAGVEAWTSFADIVARSFGSAPAQNALSPAPVMTTQRSARSPAARARCPSSSDSIAARSRCGATRRRSSTPRCRRPSDRSGAPSRAPPAVWGARACPAVPGRRRHAPARARR